jgi:hypothetical protein
MKLKQWLRKHTPGVAVITIKNTHGGGVYWLKIDEEIELRNPDGTTIGIIRKHWLDTEIELWSAEYSKLHAKKETQVNG